MKQEKSSEIFAVAAAALAAVISLLLFSSALNNGFVDFDDIGYVIENRHIDQLNWHTLVWAFTSYHEANWHPLTMLSLALDRQLWGMNPAGFHATNLVLHAGSTFIACLVFNDIIRLAYAKKSSGQAEWIVIAAGISAALFFSLHPLRVESVVWASERKDVLSMFFFVASIWWYLRFVKAAGDAAVGRRTAQRAYAMMLLAALCSLMSKPSAVSLPIVLLIIDWHPLARIYNRTTLISALKGKIPLFLMALGTAMLTVRAQQFAITMAPDVDLPSRLLVACKALFYYLWKMLCPTALGPYYPHPGWLASAQFLEYAPYVMALMAVLAIAVVTCRRQYNNLTAVLLFYLVALTPMLGIVQVGGQWIADRYSYLPALAVSLFWGGGAVLLASVLWHSGRRYAAIVVALLLASQLLVYSVMTRQQILVWKSTETLASREIELFPSQAGAAYYSRSRYRLHNGHCEAALDDIDKALSIALRRQLMNKYTELSLARAEIFSCLGRIDEARTALDWAGQTGKSEQQPEITETRQRLGIPVSPVR